MKTLYLFVDESGNFHFNPSGTKYLILATLSTDNPAVLAGHLMRLRYGLLPNYAALGKLEDNGFFHAAEDMQAVRDQVFAALQGAGGYRVDAIIAQKNKTHPSLQADTLRFYQTLGEPLLRYALNRAIWQGFEHVVVVFSSLFDNRKRGILKGAFKTLLKGYSVTFSLYFHEARCDPCCQAADYFAWALRRKWETGDLRSYSLVSSWISSEFDIFASGTTTYY